MSGTERFVSKVFIRGTIAAVWREITKTDEPQAAMFNKRMDTRGLQKGAAIRMRTTSGKYTIMTGEVLEWDPPRRMVQTFKLTRYNDPECTIAYDLAEKDGGVEFTMTSDNVPSGTRTAKFLSRGGDMIVKSVRSIVETGRAPLGTRLANSIFGLMEGMNPESAKSEHWPV